MPSLAIVDPRSIDIVEPTADMKRIMRSYRRDSAAELSPGQPVRLRVLDVSD